MDLIEACEIIRRAGDASVDYRIAAAQVLLAEREAAEVTTEWGARYADGTSFSYGANGRPRAEYLLKLYTGELVSREVRRSPWRVTT